ncbi:MAG: excinuclease ABC subunit B, partial [Mycoplasma sp.]|nr:excinuclease ABC subunit B [Mycoplasma sp.]
PKEYVKSFFKIQLNQEVGYKWFNKKLVTLNYRRTNKSPLPGEYKVNGDIIDLAPAWSQDYHYRIEFEFEKIEKITKIDFESGEILETLEHLMIYPGQAYTTDNDTIKKAIKTIQDELTFRLEELKKENKTIEYHRLETRVKNDIENLKETGFCSGIENYARHLDGREQGEKPFTLLDYFPNDSLLIIDESHMMIPQLNAMYLGDYSRKKTLVDYGFRLPSALDNRPLKFNEFQNYTFQTIYVSATPDKWEIEKSNFNVVEQIVRPTGLLDPIIEIKETKNQAQIIFDLIQEQKTKNEKTLIMTTTKRAAEILAEYLQEKNQKVSYLHSEHKTFEREEIIRKLRIGTFDVIVGINLLKEGIDIPEVSLICILEADVPGFSRSTKALIQIIGRAARNVNGRVIMFANQITKAMDEAIYETN